MAVGLCLFHAHEKTDLVLDCILYMMSHISGGGRANHTPVVGIIRDAVRPRLLGLLPVVLGDGLEAAVVAQVPHLQRARGKRKHGV